MSVQAADQADTDFRIAAAHLAQATTLKSSETMRAPFAGRITARFVDPGALVTNAATESDELATGSDDRRRPPAQGGRPCRAARCAVRPRRRRGGGEQRGGPDAHQEGGRGAQRGELDPRTRTLFVELELDNSDHFLVAGSFAYVTLHVKLRSYPEVPASALLTRGNGAFVAAVGENGTVHLQPVSVVRTDGDRVLLGEG